MTHEEWIAAERPHWQCSVCKGIYVTVAPPDNLVCCLCITDGRKHLCSNCGSELLESGWCNQCSPKYLESIRDINDQEIFYVGSWNRDEYGRSDLDAMVDAYGKVGFKPLLKLGWPDANAIGRVENLRRIGDSLIADFKGIPKATAEIIRNGGYNKSAEIYWDFVDEAGGHRYPRVIRSVALLPTNLSKNIGIRPEASKPAKFTAEELRKIEDSVKKEIDGQDELRQAVSYAYLNGLGWRMTKAQRAIDKALE